MTERGESTDSLEARQAPLAIVSTESVAGTSTTPHTSQAGSIEPPQLMEDKASTSGQQPSLQNPPYPFGQLNLRQIKEEIENSQAIHSSLQLPANPSSIAELSAEMQQYLRSAQQQMPSYQAPMLFGPGFNFTQAGSVQQPSTMDQFMQPQSFKTHPFGSSAATATVLATATPFDYSPLFGTSTSGGNTISSFYQQQGQSGSSGIGLPSAGSHLVTTSLDSRRGSHGTTSFDSNPFSLVHGANLMHIAGAGSSDMPSSSGLQMQTSIVTSSSSACDDQKLCAVCNDHAICQHYGARTCEGCKGFFKRTVQKKAQYVCAGNKNCPIDKRYRSRCQYCRFQKCIAVGMVKEVVRYGVLSGRRGRLPSKAKTSAGSQLNDQPPSPPLPILTIIAKAFADTRSNNPLMTTSDKNFTVSEMMEILEAEIMSIFNFIQKIPDMVDIKSDQQTLLWWSFFPLFALKQAYRITELNLVEATFIFENGQVAKLSSIPAEFRSLFEEIHKVAQQFRNLVEWDLASFTALLVLQYLGVSEEGPRPNLVDQHSVDRLHSTIINALKDHCCNVATPQPSKLAKIVAQVSQFSNFRTLGVLCLELVRKSGQKLRDLLAEIYHSCYDVREAVGESSADQEGQSQVGQTGSVADQADLPASSGTTAEKDVCNKAHILRI
uniref:Uncharacterized protein n=1 Tax=Acrobeloides nanus TaxID=290746 RepID=A0A914BUX2_9BILA